MHVGVCMDARRACVYVNGLHGLTCALVFTYSVSRSRVAVRSVLLRWCVILHGG